MLKFGSIFRHRENHYVYLVQKDDLFFVAKIVDPTLTRELEQRQLSAAKKPHKNFLEGKVFCYVILTSGEFKDHSANYGEPLLEPRTSMGTYSELDPIDVESLKKEILEDKVAMPALKEAVKNVFDV